MSRSPAQAEALRRIQDERHAEARSRFRGDSKRCLTCERWLPLDAFARSQTGLGGVRAHCRSCSAANRRRGNPYREQRHREVTDSHKRCNQCRLWKPLHEYHPHKKGLGGVVARCRDCTNERKRILNNRKPLSYHVRQEERSNERRRERDAIEKKRRRDSVDFILSELMSKHGLRISDIEKFTGLTDRTIRRLIRKETKYIWPSTETKLREMLDDMLGMS